MTAIISPTQAAEGLANLLAAGKAMGIDMSDLLNASMRSAEDACALLPELKQRLEAAMRNGKGGALAKLAQMQQESAGREVCETPTSGANACTAVQELIYNKFFANCQKIPCPALMCALVTTINQHTYPQYRNVLGKTEAYFETIQGFVGPGKTGDGSNTDTTFVDTFQVDPGKSIMLRVNQKFILPYIPGCFWGSLSFTNNNNNEAEVNYSAVTFKFWSGDRGVTSPTQLFQWGDDVFIYGSRFRCGDACTRVPISNPTNCDELNIVGPESSLYLQIDNALNANESIKGQQLVIEFGGMEVKCCAACAVGKACGCKGGHKH